MLAEIESFFVPGECRKTKAKKAVNEHQSLYHLWPMKIRSTGFKLMKARITRLRSFGYDNTELILLPNQKIGHQSVHVGSALTMKTKFMHAPRAYILTLTYSISRRRYEYCTDSAIPTEMIRF